MGAALPGKRGSVLVNPHSNNLEVVPGTRILADDFGLSGFQCHDIYTPGRSWLLQYLCAPIENRRLSGLRARFIDNKGFVSFCNQRDLEVLLGMAQPGTHCYWADSDYVEVGSPEWYGMCLDSEDLEDDLLDRELRLREQYPDILPSHIELVRRLHSGSTDSEELLLLVSDMDTATGYGPDPRFETLTQRWVRIEKTPLYWPAVDS